MRFCLDFTAVNRLLRVYRLTFVFLFELQLDPPGVWKSILLLLQPTQGGGIG